MTPALMMILAAGRGTRMRDLALKKPKPLLSVNGRTLLDRIVDQGLAVGINRYVVNTCYKAEMIEKSLSDRKDVSVRFSREMKPLETGGGVLNALPLLLPEGENGFFVVNADPLWKDKTVSVFEQLSKAWDPTRMDILLALIPTERAGGDVHNGNYFIENNRPKRHQKSDESFVPYLFTGIQIIHPRIFQTKLPDVFSLRVLYDQAEAHNRLGHIVYDGNWYHVGTPEALAKTEADLKLNKFGGIK